MAAPNNLIVLADRGARNLLNAKRTYLSSLRLRLFKNDFTPTHTSVDADFTEATFDGYGFQNVGDLGPPVTNSNPPDADLGPVPFTFTATGGTTANTVYGWFCTDPADGDHWVFAARTNLTSPAVIDAAGKSITIPLRFTEGVLTAYP